MTEAVYKRSAQHGTQIFVYNNIRTNQIIYSLTRSLDNHTSLKQLPFLGKKTVPARIRKDLWHPLCLVEFPRPSQGLLAYRRLREFRRLHETAYPLSLITQTEGRHKGQLHSTKKRGKILMDQKANSIADLAAVLLRADERLPLNEVEQRKVEERIVEQKSKMDERLKNTNPERIIEQKSKNDERLKTTGPEREFNLEKEVERREAKKREMKIARKETRVETIRKLQKKGIGFVVRKDPQEIEKGGVEGVKIRWANLLDAEFAEQWPDAVVHDGLTRHRYTAAFPLVEEIGDALPRVEKKPDEQKKPGVPVSVLGSGTKPVVEMTA